MFSLILATINRSKEIKECLLSIENQVYKNYEVIIIDQSNNNQTQRIVEEFSHLNIQYHMVDFTGLSKARNYGINHAKGDYCCLLDDDAIYSKEYLFVAKNLLQRFGNVVLSGIILNIKDQISPFVHYKSKNESELKIKEIISTCPSAALIFPRKAFLECGGFNEELGVGTKFASGEETDFLLRLHDIGYKIVFCNSMLVYHPIKKDLSFLTVHNHYLGQGRLFFIDFVIRKKFRLIELFFKNTIGMLTKAYILDRKNKKYYLTRLIAFIKGFVASCISVGKCTSL